MSTVAAIVIVGIGLIIAAIALAIVLFKKKSGDDGHRPPAPPPPGCNGAPLGRLADPGEFYSITSNGGSVGRTVDGDYVVNGKVVEKGLGDAKSMASPELLLTYAHGHSFYGKGGGLTGSCWDDHARGFAPSLKRCGPASAPNKVLVIEKGAKMCLDTDASFEGLVIRHGGQVLVAGTVTLRVQFLMIESGGLLQAGSAYDDKFRFDGQLTILLVHSDGGYATMGCPASQYSYQVYAPGVTTAPLPGTQPPTFAPYTGMTAIWNNTYGPKAVCVGFNGNYHLAGALGPKVPYTGTWNARDSTTGEELFGPSDRLSIADSGGAVPALPDSYATCWAPLAPGQYKKGDSTVKVSSPAGSLSWWAGKEIVILACPRQYTTSRPHVNPTGLLPIWVNNKDPAQQKANSDATAAFLAKWPPAASINGPDDSIPGVEVQRVKSVSDDGTLTLESPLVFDHSTGPKKLSRSYGGSRRNIEVDCPVHVGVLSRNIVVTSELRAGGSGCNVLYSKDSLTSMLPGRAGTPMAETMRLSGMEHHAMMLTSLAQSKGGGAATRGPGGSVVCNNEGGGADGSKPIFENCYADLPYSSQPYCGDEAPVSADAITGHWLWGTDGVKGCGAIHGGQHFFRYGSAICIDSAELKLLGTPGNFGGIGQYSIHFHLCGYGKSFTGYLPSGSTYPRELIVRNSAIWLSLARWITVHGTTEAEISNNVGFMTFGSGYFVEDGVELYNTFDHNLGAYAVPAVQSDYLNTPPIYPNVSSDFAQMSVFWFKNNGNTIARNVAACSPTPVIGFWMVPQMIGPLRGPSTLVLGSEPLQLPGLQARGNALGNPNRLYELSQSGNNNKDGKFETVSGGSTNTPCWVPDNFPYALITKDRCLAYSDNNAVVPYMNFMENVAYAVYMLLGEMPEMLLYGGLRYDLTASGAVGVGSQLQDNKPRAQWLPVNGQNACTDKYISAYPQAQWIADLPYQPLTDAEIEEATKATWTFGGVNARALPKIISGSLAFCLGPFSNIWGGTAWMKQSAWNINCAFIDTADADSQWGGISRPDARKNTPNISASFDTRQSTVFIQSSGNFETASNATYPVYHNLITNGYVSLTGSPALWTGDKTFYDDRCLFMCPTEEVYTSMPCIGINKMFCNFGSLKLQDVIPNPVPFGIDTSAPKFPGVFFYDMPASQLATVDMKTGKWSQEAKPFPEGGNQTKFPFICKDDHLRLASEGQDPDFNQKHGLGVATANLVTGHFYTKAARDHGDSICKGLYAIPPTLGPQGWPGRPC